jgi:hypothetical protein
MCTNAVHSIESCNWRLDHENRVGGLKAWGEVGKSFLLPLWPMIWIDEGGIHRTYFWAKMLNEGMKDWVVTAKGDESLVMQAVTAPGPVP